MALAHMIKEAEESQDLLLARQRPRKAKAQTVVQSESTALEPGELMMVYVLVQKLVGLSLEKS